MASVSEAPPRGLAVAIPTCAAGDRFVARKRRSLLAMTGKPQCHFHRKWYTAHGPAIQCSCQQGPDLGQGILDGANLLEFGGGDEGDVVQAALVKHLLQYLAKVALARHVR